MASERARRARGAPARRLDRPARARDSYLAENGFTLEGYDEAWTPASMFGLRFKVPNTKRHRWAIMWHDVHHVLTGYGTGLIGEAEVSAWECRGGLRPLGLYTGWIVLGLALLGLVVAPRRTLAAWRAGPAQGSLFHEPCSYETALTREVGELREALGLPRAGLAHDARELQRDAPQREVATA